MKLFFKIFKFYFIQISKFQSYVNKGYLLSKYNIHKSVGLKSTTKIFGDGKIFIGKGTYIGSNSYIVSNPKKASISIGENCMISHDVHIRTSQYDTKTIHMKKNQRKTISNDISIGNNVWIGKGVYIKGGVTIKDNVTVGANSVVVKDVDSNLIIAGIPAKILRSR